MKRPLEAALGELVLGKFSVTFAGSAPTDSLQSDDLHHIRGVRRRIKISINDAWTMAGPTVVMPVHAPFILILLFFGQIPAF